MSFSVKIIQDDLTPMLASYQQNMSKEVTEKIYSIGEKIIQMAQELCPVRTGRLRSSIYNVILGDLLVEIGAEAEYALFVEFGTYKMAARPFLLPSVMAHEGDLLNAILDGVMESFR